GFGLARPGVAGTDEVARLVAVRPLPGRRLLDSLRLLGTLVLPLGDQLRVGSQERNRPEQREAKCFGHAHRRNCWRHGGALGKGSLEINHFCGTYFSNLYAARPIRRLFSSRQRSGLQSMGTLAMLGAWQGQRASAGTP